MATEGLRVLALAFRQFSGRPNTAGFDAIETDLSFLGLVGLIAPHPEAKEAVALCKTAGITPVMIAGNTSCGLAF